MWPHSFFMHLLDENRYEAIEDGRVNEKFFERVEVCTFVGINIFKQVKTEILLNCDITFLFC